MTRNWDVKESFTLWTWIRAAVLHVLFYRSVFVWAITRDKMKMFKHMEYMTAILRVGGKSIHIQYELRFYLLPICINSQISNIDFLKWILENSCYCHCTSTVKISFMAQGHMERHFMDTLKAMWFDLIRGFQSIHRYCNIMCLLFYLTSNATKI